MALFFKIFKKYYNPIKPLYLCKNEEQTNNCLFNENIRNKFKQFKLQLNNN